MNADVVLVRSIPDLTGVEMKRGKMPFDGRSRRRRPPMQLTERLVLTLTKEEKLRIEAKARELGISMTQYVVQRALEGTEPVAGSKNRQ